MCTVHVVCACFSDLIVLNATFFSGHRSKPFWKRWLELGGTKSDLPEIPSTCKFNALCDHYV